MKAVLWSFLLPRTVGCTGRCFCGVLSFSKCPVSCGVLQNRSKVNKRKNTAKVAKPSCLAALHQQLLCYFCSSGLPLLFTLKNAASFVMFVLFFSGWTWFHGGIRADSWLSQLCVLGCPKLIVSVALCWVGDAENRMIGKTSCGNPPWYC